MSGSPGWYGKLPSLGDFASRRLAHDFIEQWDLWLGEGLAAQRATLGEAWLEAYLNSPVWRFVLLPGVLPPAAQPQALAGVLMPSVDRVGRYFPLTIVAPLARLPAGAVDVEHLLGWLHRLEDVALDALQDDWSIDQLDEVLAALPDPVGDAAVDAARSGLEAALAAGGGFVDIASIASRSELAGLVTRALAGAGDAWQRPAAGHAFWLADNPAAPRLLVSRGLPSSERFIEMLGTSGRGDGATTIF